MGLLQLKSISAEALGVKAQKTSQEYVTREQKPLVQFLFIFKIIFIAYVEALSLYAAWTYIRHT